MARLLALLACVLLVTVVQGTLLLIVRREHRALTWAPMLFHRVAARLLGLRVEVVGVRSDAPRTAWVANHLSYLDVPVLGMLLPARFVAKEDVRGWPLFGLMSRLQRTVFIGRRSVDASHALGTMSHALAEGSSIVLFAEGTTSDGRDVGAFRPPAFALLCAAGDLVVQPVTLRVRGPDAAAPRAYAYIDDDRIHSHLWQFLARARTDVQVILHSPIAAASLGTDRKAAAARVQAIVASALAAADRAA